MMVSVRPIEATRRPDDRRGFTLIELLVVIAMIAVLLSLLLPSMVGARRTGQRVVCMATLRDIAQGGAQYANENEDWIVGAPSGSGAYLASAGTAYGPAVQRWDFMGPLAEMWNLGIPQGDGSNTDVIARFNAYRNNKAFMCPANRFIAMRFSGPDARAGWMIAYNTCRYQVSTEAEVLGWNHNEKLPKDWRPSYTRIGDASKKILVSDGARYSTVNQVPDYDLSVAGPYGGAFSDTGVYSSYSRSWDRSRAPGNGNTGPVDARMYAFRHSLAEPAVGAAANAYKGNFAFFDGHVDTMGDLDASNPFLWLPKGSTLRSVQSSLWPDAVRHFGLSGDVKIN